MDMTRAIRLDAWAYMKLVEPPLNDEQWEWFIAKGLELITKYAAHGERARLYARDYVFAVQGYFEALGQGWARLGDEDSARLKDILLERPDEFVEAAQRVAKMTFHTDILGAARLLKAGRELANGKD